MSAIIRMPCVHEGYYNARVVLRDPHTGPEARDAALDVLRHSDSWIDIDLCRRETEALKSAARRLTEAEVANFAKDMPRKPAPGPARLSQFFAGCIFIGFAAVTAFHVAMAGPGKQARLDAAFQQIDRAA